MRTEPGVGRALAAVAGNEARAVPRFQGCGTRGLSPVIQGNPLYGYKGISPFVWGVGLGKPFLSYHSGHFPQPSVSQARPWKRRTARRRPADSS